MLGEGARAVYRFAGFFAKPLIDRPADLPDGTVWRTISFPFVGVGVRLPSLIGESPVPVKVEELLRKVGLHTAKVWLYLTYDCWAGRIDYVYGLGASDGRGFGPIDESAANKAQAAYLSIMGEFGITPTDALDFQPFVRDFWGEE